jgi:hypothetical protein
MDSFFAYDANYLIDNKAGIIIDAEGTRANRVVEISVNVDLFSALARDPIVLRWQSSWRWARGTPGTAISSTCTS